MIKYFLVCILLLSTVCGPGTKHINVGQVPDDQCIPQTAMEDYAEQLYYDRKRQPAVT